MNEIQEIAFEYGHDPEGVPVVATYADCADGVQTAVQEDTAKEGSIARENNHLHELFPNSRSKLLDSICYTVSRYQSRYSGFFVA